jgi:hypothetical protein
VSGVAVAGALDLHGTAGYGVQRHGSGEVKREDDHANGDDGER